MARRTAGLLVALGVVIGLMALAAGPAMAAKKRPLRGVLVVSAGPNILRFAPPLIISEADIAQAVETVGEVLAEV